LLPYLHAANQAYKPIRKFWGNPISFSKNQKQARFSAKPGPSQEREGLAQHSKPDLAKAMTLQKP